MTADWYTKRDAAAVSAAAVILMMIHHFFGFKSYLADGVEWESLLVIGGIEIERVLAAFGKICVAVFAFNSGYVLWKLKESYASASARYARALSFLVCYWLILALFWLYAVLAGEPLPEIKDALYNLVGLSTGPAYPFVNVAFAWYVAYYLVFLLLSPLLIRLFGGSWKTDLLSAAVIIALLSVADIGFMDPMTAGIEGLLFAKYSLFNRFAAKVESPGPVISFVSLIGLIVFRQGVLLIDNHEVILGGVDVVAVPVFIYLIVNLIRRARMPLIDSFVALVSACAMNLWFIHGIFFTGNRPLQQYIYAAKYPPLIFAIGFAISLALAYFVMALQKPLKNKINTISRKWS